MPRVRAGEMPEGRTAACSFRCRAERSRRQRAAVREGLPSLLRQLEALAEKGGSAPRAEGHTPVVLQLGPRDFSLLAWVRDEEGAPVYRVARTGINSAKVAATIARKRQG